MQASSSTTPSHVCAFAYLFTGKERDSETNLDYFGARYFSGAQGRFTTPDWSATPQPVPYADLTDPQTLNLYGFRGSGVPGQPDPSQPGLGQ
jgi:RHS repeat-associated protein